MNLIKSFDFFNPDTCEDQIHIIGCGAIGSTVAENLVRFGLKNIKLYDFDVVKEHNITNQMFTAEDIDKLKTDALKSFLCKINPELSETITLYPEGYNTQKLSGYVFLCVDDIELRKKIVVANKLNKFIKAVFDFRMRLTDAQHYAADWSNPSMVANLIKSMNFTHKEAMEETPVSGCNIVMSIVPTVRTICAYGVNNFINFVKSNTLKKLILVDINNYLVDTFN